MSKRGFCVVAAVVAACVVILGVGTLARGVPEGESADGVVPSAGVTAEESGAAEAGPGAAGGAPGEEWPGQGSGYVGPGGEGAVDPDDYATDEGYNAALIEAGEPEVEIERVPIPFDESGQSGYMKGFLSLAFFADCGEQQAREIVEELGGVWVSDTFAWQSTQDLGYANVSAYFPDSPYEDDLREIMDRLTSYPEVKRAILSGWSRSLAVADERNIVGVQTNDPDAGKQYWLEFVRFHQGWEESQVKRSVAVAILDSGIDLDHPDLANNIGTLSMPYDAYHATVLQGANQDTCGHGTEVAGVVAGVANNGIGIAGGSYNATLIPIRITSSDVNVDYPAVERAFEYLFSLKSRPRVVNMSFADGGKSFQPDGIAAGAAEKMKEAYEDYDMVLIASSGNSYTMTDLYPASLPEVISVAAVNENGQWADFSTYNSMVDLCAPGVGIYTTQNPLYSEGSMYGVDTGTSFSAPQVSAVAAMILAQTPTFSAEQVNNKLKSTARKLQAMSDSNTSQMKYGSGAVDAAAAVGWIPSSSGSSPAAGIWPLARDIVYPEAA